MRFMTFNIQHGLVFHRGEIDLGAFAAVIAGERADVCGLNEVRGDGDHARGYTDQTSTLSELLGCDRFFGQATVVEGDNPYGNALLSRYPISDARVIPVPDPAVRDEPVYYETRCVIEAALNTPEGNIACLICHMGLAAAEAANAVCTLCDCIDRIDLPLVVMGDFNNVPDASVLTPLFERLSDTASLFPAASTLTYPSFAPESKIDYLLYRGMTCTEAYVLQDVVSDHFPIVAQFTLS